MNNSNMPNSGYIPDDIIEDILSRLPSKSLLRFKSVCTSWYPLISSPDFISLHSLQLSQNPKILCMTSPSQFQLLDSERSSFDKSCLAAPLRFPIDTPIQGILGSSCGLVCIASGTHRDRVLYLWNLFTREFRKIPDLKRPIFIASAHGLGYDPVHNDLKLVLSNCRNTYHVFSMKSNSWKSITCPPKHMLAGKSRAVVLNGVFHWLKTTCSSFSSHLEIVTFNSIEDKFSRMRLPQVPFSPFRGAQLLEHNGRFCISFSVCEQTDMEMWMLKGQTWISIISTKHMSRCISGSGSLVIFHYLEFILKYTKEDMFEIISTRHPFNIISEATICAETLISPNDIINVAWKWRPGNR